MKISALLKTGLLLASKHKTAILSGVAIASAIGSVGLAIKATSKSKDEIREREDADKAIMRNEADQELSQQRITKETYTTKIVEIDNYHLSKKEIFRMSWKHYILPTVSLASSITCIICAHRIDAKKIAAAAAALSISETARKELEEKTLEEVGAEKFQAIRNKIAQDKCDKHKTVNTTQRSYPENAPNAVVPYETSVLFMDAISGQYFRGTRNEVDRIINDVMRKGILESGIITLNDLYYHLGIEETELGSSLGWRTERQDLIVSYDSAVAANGEPCLVMNFASKPVVI